MKKNKEIPITPASLHIGIYLLKENGYDLSKLPKKIDGITFMEFFEDFRKELLTKLGKRKEIESDECSILNWYERYDGTTIFTSTTELELKERRNEKSRKIFPVRFEFNEDYTSLAFRPDYIFNPILISMVASDGISTWQGAWPLEFCFGGPLPKQKKLEVLKEATTNAVKKHFE